MENSVRLFSFALLLVRPQNGTVEKAAPDGFYGDNDGTNP